MDKEIWSKKCPSCLAEISYKTKYALNSALIKNTKCSKCRCVGVKKSCKVRKLSVFQKEFWIKKGMSEIEAVQKVAIIQGKISSRKSSKMRSKIANETSPFKKETWLKKGLSEEQAEFEVKSRRKCNIEYWIKKGFSREEALCKMTEFQSTSSKNPRGIDVIPTQIGYWVKKGFSEEEAIEKRRDRQSTFTLEKCILKHGTLEGTNIFNERHRKWKEKVYGEHGAIGKSYSKLNEEISKFLLVFFPDIRYFANKEWYIWDKTEKKVHMYDICEPIAKKIIEINGDFWHMNPLKYDKDFINPSTKLKASQKWELDRIKVEAAKSAGYEVLIIWESEYKQNTEQTLEKCKNFLR
jgi:G:T-mismatch repair DNA endonuclease (very short patch repair protein)